jgi:two-component sensor histidine kinase
VYAAFSERGASSRNRDRRYGVVIAELGMNAAKYALPERNDVLLKGFAL